MEKKETRQRARIYYCDIGDYLSREEKIAILREKKSFSGLDLTEIHPNEHGDWLTTRDEALQEFIPMTAEKKFTGNSQGFFNGNSLGVATGRDSWCYNFSKNKLCKNIKTTIDFYERQRIQKTHETDLTKLSWNRTLSYALEQDIALSFDEKEVRTAHYRPFVQMPMYFNQRLNEMVYKMYTIYPENKSQNLVICVSGKGVSKEFSAIISDCIPDLQVCANGQCFPLYYYKENKTDAQSNLFSNKKIEKYTRKDGISDFIHQKALAQYGGDVTREDIFYYVYGILHSPEYRERFADDLKKSLPRLPLVKDRDDFEIFSKAGRALADLHLNYENRKPPKTVRVMGAENGPFRVTRMKFGGAGKNKDKSIIQFNEFIRIEGIPLEAYEYIVNGKSALEWIMERYAIKTDKASGIVNDPNDWAAEHHQPRYILDLLLSLITVSVETMKIVHSLPTVMDRV